MTQKRKAGHVLLREAAIWRSRLERGASAKERKEFLAWLSRDAEHVRYTLELHCMIVEAREAVLRGNPPTRYRAARR
jgi:ferric-dicitrate binding protein FerR (iron transport regulator)